MGRLKALPPRLGTLKPHRIQQPEGKQEYDKHRNHQEWRKWYKTKRWQQLRWAVLTRDMFTCQMCSRVEPRTSQLVADHKVRHGGDAERFWDADGIQCLCAPCHNSTKQRQENAARLMG